MEANQGKADLFAVIRALAEMLNAPELEALRRAFNVWIKGLLKRHERDNRITKTVDDTDDILEGYSMAEATYEIFSETIKDTIRNEIEETVRKESEAKLLIRLLTRRFGQLPKWAETRVSNAKSEQLEKWFDMAFNASSLTEVIGPPA